MSKDKTNNEPGTEYLSICDIWKDSVHKIITKAEFQTPLYLQTYTQVHTEFLHSIDNLFGTCYLWQKQYFDRLEIDKGTMGSYAKFYDDLTEYTTKLMDAWAQSQKQQADMMIQAINAANGYARQYMDLCAKAVSEWGLQRGGGDEQTSGGRKLI